MARPISLHIGEQHQLAIHLEQEAIELRRAADGQRGPVDLLWTAVCVYRNRAFASQRGQPTGAVQRDRVDHVFLSVSSGHLPRWFHPPFAGSGQC